MLENNVSQVSNAELAKSTAELGISEAMISESIDRNYAQESLPLLAFASLYYLVLTAIHILVGEGSGHNFLAVFTVSIAAACFIGRHLIKSEIIESRHIHVLAMVLLLGLIGETNAQIWMAESSEPIAEIVIAVMIMGIVLIKVWNYLLLCSVLFVSFFVLLFGNDAFSAYLDQPYVLLLVFVSFALSLIIFHQRRVGVIRNTKLHLIDQELNAELLEANAAKNQFLSVMSHELRTPLNAIYGFSQLLQADSELADKHQSWVGHVLKSSELLLHLISQVLNLSKIESEHIEIKQEEVVAEELIDTAITMTSDLTAENEVQVHKQIASNAEKLCCHTDQSAMQQILLNLLSNAIKYNRFAGSVTLKLFEADQKVLVIQIIDTGMGIPKDKQGQLFEPFNRLGQEESSISGTGIGLTITANLCDALGVELSFESEEGVGTTFSLAIPR